MIEAIKRILNDEVDQEYRQVTQRLRLSQKWKFNRHRFKKAENWIARRMK